MNRIQFYAGLRQEPMQIITGVKNSDPLNWWNDSQSNLSIKIDLEKIYNHYLKAAKNFGLLVVTRHCSCPSSKHIKYVSSNTYGLVIPYQSNDFIWTQDQMYQDNRYCSCPCEENAKPTTHWVIDDVVYEKWADTIECKKITSILQDVNTAIEAAEDKKPRSGIREYLLRAILKINDVILPIPMNEYISKLKYMSD